MSNKNPGAPKKLRQRDRAWAVQNTAKNARLRAERHAKRMASQVWPAKGHTFTDEHGTEWRKPGPKVPRGTARALRRLPLQVAYAKRQAIEARPRQGAEA